MAWLPSFLQSRAHAAVNEGFDWLRTWWTQTWRFTKRKERSDKETNGGEKKRANESRNIIRNYRQEDAWHFWVVSIKIDGLIPLFLRNTRKTLKPAFNFKKTMTLYLFLQFPFNTFNLTFDYNLHPKAWVKIYPILWYLTEGKSD